MSALNRRNESCIDEYYHIRIFFGRRDSESEVLAEAFLVMGYIQDEGQNQAALFPMV
jgi:hypothetical protein